MTTRTGSRARTVTAVTAVAALVALAAGCASGSDRVGTVSQSWTGISPTGNSLDVGSIVAGIVTDDGDRNALTVLPVTGNTATAECAGDTVTLTVDGWTVATTRGDQSITVHNNARGVSSTVLDLTRPVPGLTESITWHDGGRVDITAAADTPTSWGTAGTFAAAATVICPAD